MIYITPLTEDEMLTYIENNIRKTKPKKTTDSREITEQNLAYRIEDAYETAILLYRHGKLFDAFMIAGYILETSAILDWIKLSDDNLNRYKTQGLLEALKLALTWLQREIDEDLHEQFLIQLSVSAEALKGHGKHIIKKNKNNKEIVDYLSGPASYAEKLHRLKDYDNVMNKNDIIENYINGIAKILRKNNTDGIFNYERNMAYLIKDMYKKYCNCKHSNFFTIADMMSKTEEQEFDYRITTLLYMMKVLKK